MISPCPRAVSVVGLSCMLWHVGLSELGFLGLGGFLGFCCCLNWDSWDFVGGLVLGWGVFVCPLSCGCLLMGILPLRLFRGAGSPSPCGSARRSGHGTECTALVLELRSLYFDLGSFPLHRLFLFGKRTTPERGQMLRRAACQTASNLFQTRHASPDRVPGRRRGAWGHRSEYAAFLRFTLAGSSRAVASLL